MKKLAPLIHDTENGLDYILVGEIYLPLIAVPEETRDIGFYGSLRRNYLRDYKSGLYSYLSLSGKLWTHLADVNEQCVQRRDLLSTGELYAADEKLQKIKDVYYPILKIIRQEDENKHLEYVIVSEEQGIEIHWNAEIIRSITQKEMAKRAAYLYEKIVEGGSRAFEIPGSDTIMNELACTKISAPSTDKTDITMQIHDINTGYEPICGFSIKSELGSAPTLLNASGATNFVYEVSGISDELAEQINAIDSKTKILDRIQMITENGTMKYSHMKNKVFSGNLMLIDTYMEEIIAHLLLLYYQNQATDSDKLIRIIEEQNPLGYPRKGIYAYKFKKFLCSIALGMMPSKEWDGHDEANGGYVIVKDNGEVLAYHIYNRDAFEKYLLNNTKFERGSTGKHGFATLYMENGKRYINLNLQIRFI